ncbi:unnamed protein product, partial [Trichogramma brassicae]
VGKRQRGEDKRLSNLPAELDICEPEPPNALECNSAEASAPPPTRCEGRATRSTAENEEMPTTSTWALEYSSPELLLKEQESRSAADGDSPASTTSTGTKPKVLASKCKRNEEGHDTDGKLEELLQQCTRVSREGIEKTSPMQTSEWRAERDAKLAALATENRDFIMLQLNGKRYKALYDSGAQVSLVGPHIAKKLAKHLKGRATSISTPCAPSLVSTLGHIEVRINIDGQWEKVIWKAMGYLDHDVILGADFKKAVEHRHAR